MRRLLQFATLLLILTAFVTPLAEFFDRWDAPGLGSDSETGTLCVLLLVCLVLLVCRLVALLAVRLQLVVLGSLSALRSRTWVPRAGAAILLFSPPRSLPLRI